MYLFTERKLILKLESSLKVKAQSYMSEVFPLSMEIVSLNLRPNFW